MGRVVIDTDMMIWASCSSNAFETVDLPAPDGDDNTSIKPRLEIVMAEDFSSLLNVLHLLVKLTFLLLIKEL